MTLHVDKSQWAAGPWQQEPDRVEFQHAGLACLIPPCEREPQVEGVALLLITLLALVAVLSFAGGLVTCRRTAGCVQASCAQASGVRP